MGNADWGSRLMARTPAALAMCIVVVLVGNVVALAAHDESSSGGTVAQRAAGGSVGSPGAAEAQPGEPTTTVPGAGSQSAQPAPPSTSAKPTSTTTTTIDEPTPEDYGYTPPPTWPPGYVYDVSITPSCARVGEELTMVFKVKPSVGVIWMATYADGLTHETMGAATADANGTVQRKWKAPPAPGEALMQTQAADRETERTGATDVSFRIVAETGLC